MMQWNGWFVTGMDLDGEVLNERLGDPTYWVDPALEKLRLAKQVGIIAPGELIRTQSAGRPWQSSFPR